MKQSLISYFPFKNMRKSQLKVLNEIEEAIDSGYRQIVLEAATGFGKSPIAIAIAGYFGSSYICTSTINLQDQYKYDFDVLNKVMGKRNFRCRLLEERSVAGNFTCKYCKTNDINKCKHVTADKAPCLSRRFKCQYKTIRSDYDDNVPRIGIKEHLIQLNNNPERAERIYYEYTNDHPAKKRVFAFLDWDHYKAFGNTFKECNYFDQKNIGLFSSHTLLNYAIFSKFSSVVLKGANGTKRSYLPRKSLLVLDEGHLFEDEVIKHNGEELDIYTIRWLTDDSKEFNMMPDYKMHEDWLNYLNHIIEYIDIHLAKLDQEEEKLMREKSIRNLDEKETKRLEYLPRLMFGIKDRFDKIYNVVKGLESNPSNWIIDKKEFGNKTTVSFKPLDVSEYCNKLYAFADNLLIMSATILDKNMYCKQVGLDPNKIKFISVDSEFPVENRPIFKEYVGKLNKDNMSDKKTHEIIASKLIEIMKRYNGKRGLIHMPNNKSTDDVMSCIHKMDRIQYLRLKVVKDMTAEERKDMIEDFKRNPNSVFISPSLYVGIDLKDDLSRFQVIVKVPYASLGDKWIKTKFNLDKKWYEWQTILKAIQGYGRSIRHSDDFCDTILLDEQFESLFRYSFNLLPESFKDAIRYGAQNPAKKTLNRIPNILEVKDFR